MRRVVVALLLAVGTAGAASSAIDGRQGDEGGVLRAYVGNAAGDVVVPSGGRGWVDFSALRRIEWEASEGRIPGRVVAAFGKEAWSLSPSAGGSSWVLSFSKGIVVAAGSGGLLTVTTDTGERAELRAIPSAPVGGLGAGRVEVRLDGASPLPSFDEWLDVRASRYAFGSVRGAVETKRGDLASGPFELRAGDPPIVFWLGDREFSLSLEKGWMSVLGERPATFRATERWRPSAEADAAVAATPWCGRVQRVSLQVGRAASGLVRVRPLLEGGRIDDARALLGLASLGTYLAEIGLRSLDRAPAIALGEQPADYPLKAWSAAPIPGTAGWAEAVVGDVRDGKAVLSVRTPLGRTLAPPTKVGEGDVVRFRVGEKDLVTRVERAVGGRFATRGLRLRSFAAAADDEPAEVPDVGNRGDGGDRIEREVLRLLAAEARSSYELGRAAVRAVGNGDMAGAVAALNGASACLTNLEAATAQLPRLSAAPLLGPGCTADDLSLVRVLVTSVEPLSALDPESRVWSTLPDDAARSEEASRARRLMSRAASAIGMPDAANFEAGCRVLESAVVGRRRPFYVRDRHAVASEPDDRFEVGDELTFEFRTDGKDEADRKRIVAKGEYWIVLTPPISTKAVPRATGGMGGRRRAVFVLETTSVR